MARAFDLIAVLIVAIVLLLPQPSVDAFPAATGDQATLFRLAALQDAQHLRPDDPETAVELARAQLEVEQPAWALATLAPFRDRGLPEVHQVLAYAYATILLPREALAQAEAGIAACERAGCDQTRAIRLSFLAGMMRKQVEAGVDPKKDPLRAKQLVSEALRKSHAASDPPKAPAPGTTDGQKKPAP